jgi:hypothetical protein
MSVKWYNLRHFILSSDPSSERFAQKFAFFVQKVGPKLANCVIGLNSLSRSADRACKYHSKMIVSFSKKSNSMLSDLLFNFRAP